MKRVLIITGDFTEDYETMVPFQTLNVVGYHVAVLSLLIRQLARM